MELTKEEIKKLEQAAQQAFNVSVLNKKQVEFSLSKNFTDKAWHVYLNSESRKLKKTKSQVYSVKRLFKQPKEKSKPKFTFQNVAQHAAAKARKLELRKPTEDIRIASLFKSNKHYYRIEKVKEYRYNKFNSSRSEYKIYGDVDIFQVHDVIVKLIDKMTTGLYNTRALLRTNNAVAAEGNYPALVALANDIGVNLTTFKWVMPKVKPSLLKQQELLTVISDKESVPLAFLNKRSETIAVPQTTLFTWKLQLTGGIEGPRFIIIAFQIGRGAGQTTNNASFDVAGLNVIDAYLSLNGERHPYSNVGTDFATNKYTKWHFEYLNFYNKYNNDNKGDACLSFLGFIKVAPIYVFDVSNQPEKLKNTTIDVTVQTAFAAATPANTAVYAITYFDSIYILTGDNNKQIIQMFNN